MNKNQGEGKGKGHTRKNAKGRQMIRKREREGKVRGVLIVFLQQQKKRNAKQCHKRKGKRHCKSHTTQWTGNVKEHKNAK